MDRSDERNRCTPGLSESIFQKALILVWLMLLALNPLIGLSQVVSTQEKIKEDSYYSVFHYQITIDAPAAAVWPHLIDFGSWMYEFHMIHVSGNKAEEREIIRLHETQDFLLQTVKLIPNTLYVGVHLPSVFRGELGTGTVILNLVEVDGKTIVSNTMSREYSWSHPEPNPLRKTRELAEFQESNRATWEDRFLPRLKELVESKHL